MNHPVSCFHFFCAAVPALLSLAAAASDCAGFEPEPYGWRCEAESFAGHGVAEDKSASGGAARFSDGAWQPLLITGKLPENLPSKFELWTRRKGGPVCLKSLLPDGTQKEISWTWGNPLRWKWQKAAELTPDDVASGIVIIKNGDPQKTFLDAIAVVTNTEAAAAAFVPAPEKISVRADWNSPAECKIQKRHWAVNDYEIIKTDDASPEFNAALARLAPSMIRIHHAGMANEWTLPETRDWNYKRIRKSFGNIPAYSDVPVMINISRWPDWMSKDNILPEDMHEEFASLCGKLAYFLKHDVGIKTLYVEVLNEQDNSYEQAERLPELWTLLNKVMRKIRQTVPSAKIGGPALTWPKETWVCDYLNACGSETDFLSWHNYASGSASDPDDKVLVSRIDDIQEMAEGAVRLVRESGLKNLEAFITEYNISWSWETRDRRMTNNLGAVFDAQVVLAMASAGVDGAFVWHLKDNIYGLMDFSNSVRPAFGLYEAGARILTGDIVKTAVSDEYIIKAAAIRRDNGKRAAVIINRSDIPAIVPGAFDILGEPESARISRIVIDENGKSDPASVSPGSRETKIKPFSICILYSE